MIWIKKGQAVRSDQIGHSFVNPNGLPCDCGRYGGLETVASFSYLKKQPRNWLKSQRDANYLSRRVRK
ncbi:hypothetical protein COO59_12905 [Mixta theicola]|uniref:Uncharacterized protein n=1 Tax=Mixta theicola TaxID=1458355 RepID=A0A2K1Q863_9GAMM|nr:hypothetical protein COO59_12905 [Mixta theicola]GLR07570.1 hypothetical protein GCM10007905_02890 [Mixta theicola]